MATADACIGLVPSIVADEECRALTVAVVQYQRAYAYVPRRGSLQGLRFKATTSGSSNGRVEHLTRRREQLAGPVRKGVGRFGGKPAGAFYGTRSAALWPRRTGSAAPLRRWKRQYSAREYRRSFSWDTVPRSKPPFRRSQAHRQFPGPRPHCHVRSWTRRPRGFQVMRHCWNTIAHISRAPNTAAESAARSLPPNKGGWAGGHLTSPALHQHHRPRAGQAQRGLDDTTSTFRFAKGPPHPATAARGSGGWVRTAPEAASQCPICE